MTDELFFLIQDIEVISSFLPVLVLIFTKNKTRRDLRRVLYLLSVAWLLAEVSGWILARNNINTFLIFHIYGSISTIGYLLFFRIALPNMLTLKRTVFLCGTYLFAYWFIIIWSNGYFEAVAIANILTAIVPFALALLTFYSIATEAKIINLLKEPIYWITSAVLIHFGLGLVAIVSLEYIAYEEDMILYIWPLVLVSNIIHNIIFSIGVWKTHRV